MNIIYHFSKKIEFQRIRDSLEEIPWFEEQGYDPKTQLKLPIYDYNITTEDIIDLVAQEWKQQKYVDNQKNIESYENQIKQLIDQLNKAFNQYITEWHITLTRYGSGGSYNPPNNITLNIHTINPKETIFHEIVHTFLEKYVITYNIPHWHKERTVDLILHSKEFSFLNYNNWQETYHNAENIVDKEFPLFFTDRESFFKKIA